MFDPTIFDNLKIVLEGAVYDRDLDDRWTVLNREDLVDLAKMSRAFSIQFCIRDRPAVLAKVTFASDLQDFAAEWLDQINIKPGSYLEILFTMSIKEISACEQIRHGLSVIWQGRPLIRQHLTFSVPRVTEEYQHEIVLFFDRKLDETHVDDVEAILDHVAMSLEYLGGWS